MREAREVNPKAEPYLVRKDGPQAGTRYELHAPVTAVGRAPENDIAIAGADALVVSGRHAELRFTEGRWLIRDLDSTNGTFVNGERVTEAVLEPPATIQLGKGGPELHLVDTPEAISAPDPGRTLVAERTIPGSVPATAPLASEQDQMLSEAVARARQVRHAGVLNQTGAIMREAMVSAIRHARRRLRWAVVGLAMLLAAVSAFGGMRIWQLSRAKHNIDAQIAALEHELDQTIPAGTQADRLALQLDLYQNRGRALSASPLYRFSVRTREDFLAREISTLLAEFGAEVYSIPPDFKTSVQRYLDQYQGSDRPNMARALTEARPAMDRMRRVLGSNTLPPDFAYMTLVESAMDPEQKSRAGCAGLWQFTPSTARALGLRVDGHTDERLNITKSTQAACKYIRDLILDFGSGSSVMLALAAYNLGPSKVKQAIRKVDDPIKQRNFWYLYRVRALPVETREYVPKVVAAMIIGRQPQRYGF